jgi:hypothetical protein
MNWTTRGSEGFSSDPTGVVVALAWAACGASSAGRGLIFLSGFAGLLLSWGPMGWAPAVSGVFGCEGVGR